VKELLSVGDIYLDTFPFGGVNSIIDPLESGIPVIAWEGETFRSRMGAAMLRSMKLDELVVSDADSYHTLAVRLATDSAGRQELRERIKTTMARTPVFLDQLASSEALGSLLETVYDELVQKGREAFRRDRTPIIFPRVENPAEVLAEGSAHFTAGRLAEAAACAQRVLGCNPASPEARHLYGRVLAGYGRHERAVTYLLAAVQQAEGNAQLWFDLTQSLRSSGRNQDALKALETCLRVDGKHLEAWLLLLEIAEHAGHAEMIQDAIKTLKQIAPEDPRVMTKAALAGMF
jgi:protein O-GlcNAc transferase